MSEYARTAKVDEWHMFWVITVTEDAASAQRLLDRCWAVHGPARKALERKHLTHADPPREDGSLRMIWEYRACGSNATDIARIIGKRAAEVGVTINGGDATSIAKAHAGYGGNVIDRTRRVALQGGGRDLDCWACELVVTARKAKQAVRLTATQGDTVLIDMSVTQCPLHGKQWLGDLT